MGRAGTGSFGSSCIAGFRLGLGAVVLHFPSENSDLALLAAHSTRSVGVLGGPQTRKIKTGIQPLFSVSRWAKYLSGGRRELPVPLPSFDLHAGVGELR